MRLPSHNAAALPNNAVPVLTPEEKKARQDYLTSLRDSYDKTTGLAEKTLKTLERQADNNSKLTLGIGLVGIGSSVAAGALVVASPANVVWVTALTGVAAGAGSFQTKAALEGFSRDAVARIYNDTLVKFSKSVTDFQVAYEALRSGLNNPNEDAWNTATAKAERALQDYFAAAKLLPLPSASQQSLEQIKQDNAELKKSLDDIISRLPKKPGTVDPSAPAHP